jgi:DNA-binding NtrC family response regulator
MIEAALRRAAGHKTRAARAIGWSRQKLYRRMAELGIPLDYGRLDRRSRSDSPES